MNISLFKSKLLSKLLFDDDSLTKLRRESEKTPVVLFWRGLARVRLVDSRRILKPAIADVKQISASRVIAIIYKRVKWTVV